MAINTFDYDDSSLLCSESVFDCLGTPEDEMDHLGAYKPPRFGDSGSATMIALPSLSEEKFSLMIQEGKNHLPRFDYLQRLKFGDLDMNVRSHSLEWIRKVHSYFGFGELALCLSMNYLDRFLSLCELRGDKKLGVQLLAVTCLSLGAKMVEVKVVPSIIDLQVVESGSVITAKSVMNMELILMDRLKWRMNSITPYSFIDYFIRKMMIVGKENEYQDDNAPPPFSEAMISKAVKLITSTIRGIEFLEFKASEIAAAVAIEVVGETGVDVEKAMSCVIQVEKERVMKCHNLLKDMPLLETGTGNQTCRVPYSPIGVLEVTCIIISYKIDEISVSIPDSPANSPDAKRMKID